MATPAPPLAPPTTATPPNTIQALRALLPDALQLVVDQAKAADVDGTLTLDDLAAGKGDISPALVAAARFAAAIREIITSAIVDQARTEVEAAPAEVTKSVRRGPGRDRWDALSRAVDSRTTGELYALVAQGTFAGRDTGLSAMACAEHTRTMIVKAVGSPPAETHLQRIVRSSADPVVAGAVAAVELMRGILDQGERVLRGRPR